MSIPESQLETWSGQGAAVGSANTYTSIKTALGQHSWPREMSYQVYLQGSYANSTNIRGNSDVDIVVECTSVYFHNLSDSERQSLYLYPAQHSYADFKRELLAALTSYYGSSQVDATGPNAVAVLPSGSRLKADVLHCHTYKLYEHLSVRAEGITFWNQHTGQQIINYPKQHISNGEAKNSFYRTSGRYKQTVRMFKNARERIIGSSDQLRKKYPSYFVECLFYNVPDSYFSSTFQQAFSGSVKYLLDSFTGGSAGNFTTQSGLHWLFGTDSVQWALNDGHEFVTQLAQLWENWQATDYASLRYRF